MSGYIVLSIGLLGMAASIAALAVNSRLKKKRNICLNQKLDEIYREQ